MAGPLIAAAAIPAVASAFGAERANRKNIQMMREDQRFQAGQAGRQMDFQREMSNTAWQRAVQDMRLAGINPIMAASQGGASTPGGAAGGGGMARIEDAISPAVASAQHARRLRAELRVMRETEQKIYNDAQLARNQSIESASRNVLVQDQQNRTRAETENLRMQNLMMGLEMSTARIRSNISESQFGRTLGYVERLRQALFGGAPMVRIGR